jgi:HSP90 family molecular chaperone
MSRDEVIANIGTIAKSGTMNSRHADRRPAKDARLIGCSASGSIPRSSSRTA